MDKCIYYMECNFQAIPTILNVFNEIRYAQYLSLCYLKVNQDKEI